MTILFINVSTPNTSGKHFSTLHRFERSIPEFFPPGLDFWKSGVWDRDAPGCQPGISRRLLSASRDFQNRPANDNRAQPISRTSLCNRDTPLEISTSSKSSMFPSKATERLSRFILYCRELKGHGSIVGDCINHALSDRKQDCL